MLYQASRAGVKIHLLVRGICCLKPGIPDKSENISVHSVLGRFLEHSRLFRFENSGGEPIILMGSADWMPRNFLRRVECVFPIKNKSLRKRVEQEILQTYASNLGDAKALQPDGDYLALTPQGRRAPLAQDTFLALARQVSPENLIEKPKRPSKSVRRQS
jgi:polyphosphate kinase